MVYKITKVIQMVTSNHSDQNWYINKKVNPMVTSPKKMNLNVITYYKTMYVGAQCLSSLHLYF